jgi:hypothetical protein
VAEVTMTEAEAQTEDFLNDKNMVDRKDQDLRFTMEDLEKICN